MRRRTPLSLLTSTFLAAGLVAALATARAPAFAQQEQGAAPAEEEAQSAAAAWEYPQEISAGGVRLELREPSVLSYAMEDGATELRFAVRIIDAVGRVTWGGVDITGTAHLDLSSRLVLVDGLTVTATAFPDLDPELAALATQRLPGKLAPELLLRLELFTDRLGAAPADENPTGRVSTRPPEILVRRTPAVLVQIDGEPVLEQVRDFPLEYVINSASDIFHEKRDDRWLLLVDGFWAAAGDIEGPWSWYDGKLPIVLTQLPIDHPRGHVRRYVPGTKRYAARVGKTPPTHPAELPEIIVSKEPAELVLLRGDPLFTLVPKVKLMTVANTAGDLLFHPRTGKYFLLLSGRWFVADEIDGPWAQHFGSLPEEFKRIPRDHARAHVLWSVPGTPEAAEAVARALLRERVFLHRRIHVSIKYQGEKPESSPVEGAAFRKVRNTEDDIFELGGVRYACVRGAWFRTEGPTGIWTPATELPAALTSVPEGTGAYYVNACRPLGAGEKGFYFEVWGPYRGVYVHKGAPVYGNGWEKPGLARGRNWYPMPRTYGENRWYDPLAGVFRPRSVAYDAQLVARATEWSAYTAGYGRVRWYADRYLQGGRRMFAYDRDRDAFDLSARRPDIYATWHDDVVERDGLPRERFPLGDRRAEKTPAGPPVVADENGRAYRLTDAGVELYVEDAWITPPQTDDTIRARLEALARTRSLTAALRTWAADRAAPLPVNPVVTPR